MKLPATLQSITSALRERQKERKRLRGPADLYYAIADSISMLDGASWQELAAQSGFFMSLEYLSALEQVLPLNLSARYALIFDGTGADRQLVAAVYMQIADISLAQARPEKAADTDKKWTLPLDQLAQHARQHILS